MSKQRRPPETAPGADRGGRDAERRPETALPEQEGLGNAAVQERISGRGADGGASDLDVVRDVAFPLVERAALALQLETRGAEQVERFLAILDRSHLPADR